MSSMVFFVAKLSVPLGLSVLAIVFASIGAKTTVSASVGSPGLGSPGQSCWDQNNNGVCDLADEDTNEDGVCDWRDCQGPPGPQGTPGVTPDCLPCSNDTDCQLNALGCTLSSCVNGTCNYFLPVGTCESDVHCSPNEQCLGCSCVTICNATNCQSDGCIIRYCEFGQCKSIESENGCCTNETDCLGTATVYYFTSGLYTDQIQAKTPGESLIIEGILLNEGSLHVPDGLYSYSPSFFNSTIFADVINQYTTNLGVTVESVLIKGGDITADDITTDTVTAKTTNGNLVLSGSGTGKVSSLTNLMVNTIEARTGTSVTVSGVTLDSGAITTTSIVASGAISAGSLSTSGSFSAASLNTAGSITGASLNISGTGMVTSLQTNTIGVISGSTGINVVDQLNVDTISARSTDADLVISGKGTGKVSSTSTLLVNQIDPRTGSSVTVGGVVANTGTIQLLSTGAVSAGLLGYYEEASVTATIQGLWGATTYTSTFRFVRVGTLVTLTWTAVRQNAACTSESVVRTASSTIPSRFAHLNDLYLPAIIEDNGVILSSTMVMTNSNARITWYNGNLPSAGTFTCMNSGGTSGMMAGSISYFYL